LALALIKILTLLLIKKSKKKPNNIFSSACPDNKFANNRTAKLTILDIKDTISIRKSPGNIKKGTPLGINNFINFVLCIKTLHILVPTKKQKDIKNVTKSELVTVNEYVIIPYKLKESISTKI